MEIKLDSSTLAGKKLFVGTPMYGGQCFGVYMKSCLDLQGLCMQYGVEVKFSFLFNESLINRARCYIADEFMRSDCTHMIFIDSDIGFNPLDIIAMLALDKEVIGGTYSKKCLKWSNIKKAVLKNPTISDGDLSEISGDLVFNPVEGTKQFNVSELVEVMELGTGFLMIRRSAYEKFNKAYPENFYLPDHVGSEFFSGNREICAYFNVSIDPESRRMWSEDYYFCQKVRKIGVKIWLCPFIQLSHQGFYSYSGSLPKIAHFLQEL